MYSNLVSLNVFRFEVFSDMFLFPVGGVPRSVVNVSIIIIHSSLGAFQPSPCGGSEAWSQLSRRAAGEEEGAGMVGRKGGTEGGKEGGKQGGSLYRRKAGTLSKVYPVAIIRPSNSLPQNLH